MKKLIILFVLGIFIIAGGTGLYLISKSTNRQEYENDYSLKPGYKLSTNEEFGYRFQFNESLINDIQAADNNFSVLTGNSIHGVSTRGYEIPEVNIFVFSRGLLSGKNLGDWVKSVSTSVPEDLSNNHNLKYVSEDYLSLSSNIIFLVNSNPVLSVSEPVLLIDNGQYLFQLSGYAVSSDKVLDIASSFQVKFGTTYKGLSSEDLDSIRVYFNNNEKF